MVPKEPQGSPNGAEDVPNRSPKGSQEPTEEPSGANISKSMVLPKQNTYF